eukprot:Clim_evm2s224 gene=Clim_evmTU2s224
MTSLMNNESRYKDNTDPGWGFSERKGWFGVPIRTWYFVTKSGQIYKFFYNNIYSFGWMNAIFCFMGWNAVLSIFAINGWFGLLCINCFMAVNCVNCAFAVNCINCAFQVGDD